MTDPAADLTWPLYIGYLPDSSGVQTNAGAVYDKAGVKDGRLMGGGEVIQHYGVKLKIRCDTYTTGWAKIEAIASNLDTVQNEDEVVDGNTYRIQNVKRVGLVSPLGMEEGSKERHLFEIELLVTVKIL